LVFAAKPKHWMTLSIQSSPMRFQRTVNGDIFQQARAPQRAARPLGSDRRRVTAPKSLAWRAKIRYIDVS
jgi:hypothetical protein